MCLPKAELNTKNETKRPLFNGRLVSFLVFNSITHVGKKVTRLTWKTVYGVRLPGFVHAASKYSWFLYAAYNDKVIKSRNSCARRLRVNTGPWSENIRAWLDRLVSTNVSFLLYYRVGWLALIRATSSPLSGFSKSGFSKHLNYSSHGFPCQAGHFFCDMSNRIKHQKRNLTAIKKWPLSLVLGIQLGLR